MIQVRETTTRLPSVAGSAGQARRFTRETLRGWGCACVDEAELLVSELVTNAILHARSDIDMTLKHNGEAVRIEVTDSSPERPSPRGHADDAMTGRGLGLIASIAIDWGVDPLPGKQPGKVVWCEVRL